MYDDMGALYLPPGAGRIRFSRQEILQMLIAVAALSFAFFMIMIPANASTYALGYFAAVSTVAVVTGFLMHEMAHKFVAQRYGAWAEFRIFPLGLLMAVVFSFMGFVFAAPGAVYINGRLTRLQNGLVSVMGPGLNLSLGAAMMFVGVALPLTDLTLAIYLIGRINIFLALFNLLPIPPLDGYKVATWNIGVYVVVMGASVVLFLFSMGII
jgi:Zn-dependent protease